MENKKNNILKKKTKDDSFLFSTSLIFDENIDKLWLYLRDLSFETANIDFLDDFKYIKGDNTWTVGNECSMYWVGVTHLKAKCTYIKLDRTRKKIKWKFKCDIGIDYYKLLILYRITQNGKTLVKSYFTRTENQNNLIDFSQTLHYYTDLQYNILKQQSKYLQSIKKDINIYESNIINANYLLIWNIVTNMKTLSELTLGLLINMEYKGSMNEIGSFIRYFDTSINKTVFLKITKYEMSHHKKCWIFRLEAIGTNIIDIPKLIEIKLVIINDSKAHVSFLHIFPYNSNPEFINKFRINKTNTFNNIIKYIDQKKKEKNIIQNEINVANNSVNNRNKKKDE